MRGAELKEVLRRLIGAPIEEVTKDGLFSLMEVECLGACWNAPMVQINDDFYEDLDPRSLQVDPRQIRAGRLCRQLRPANRPAIWAPESEADSTIKTTFRAPA